MVLQPGSLLPLSTSATSEPAQGGKQTERGNPPHPQRLTHTAFLATSAFVTFFFLPLKGCLQAFPLLQGGAPWGESSAATAPTHNHREGCNARRSLSVLTYRALFALAKTSSPLLWSPRWATAGAELRARTSSCLQKIPKGGVMGASLSSKGITALRASPLLAPSEGFMAHMEPCRGKH